MSTPLSGHAGTLTALVAAAPPTRLLLWSIAGFTAAMIAWASVAEINETATAPGRVVATRPLAPGHSSH